MIIAISGPPGSGKTTIGRELAKKLSFDFISGGMAFRELARKNGVSVMELNKLAESNPEIDRQVDSLLVSMAKGMKNAVIESHLAGWLLKDISDIKIYIWAPLEIRAQRIAKRDGISYETALAQIIDREWSHYKRFLQYYGYDITNLALFDLVINSGFLSVDQTVDIIMRYISEYNNISH